MGWVSPSNHEAGPWIYEVRAYDENEGSYAYDRADAWQWTSDLILTHSSISCSKVRVNARNQLSNFVNIINLDLFYGGTWHDIYQGGAFANHGWTEFEIGSTQIVTKVRLAFYNSYQHDFSYGWVYEFDFWEVEVPSAIGRSFGFIIG